MAGYNWTFTVLPNTITEIILNEVITVQKSAGQFEANYFVEGTDVTISADGYQTKTVTVGDEQITLIADIKYLSKLSNGTATYVIKDANAVHTEDVTSTYSPTGTAPVNGTAVASALPTVNNSTITITQCGVTKGSFTLNQSSGDTIALDAGSGGGLPSQTGNAGKFLTTDGTDASWATVDYSTVGALPNTTTADDIGGANKDLSNLSSDGKNISNWSSNVSNCIVEIPQDLNFELSNGTLTLKQNSKVYTKSDTTTPMYNMISDKTLTKNVDGTYFVYYTGSQLSAYSKTQYTYDTLPYGVSFPLAEITVSGGSISSINQVFNGFGYIGSTIFALPGIKGLVPNGRNADGTLNNSSFTTTAVQVFTGSGPYTRLMRFEASGNFTVSNFALDYDEAKNKMVNSGKEYSIMVAGDAYWDGSSKITSFNTKTAFHAVDYSEFMNTVGDIETLLAQV